MSRYIRVVNSLKLQIRDLEPTPSQISCINLLLDRLQYPGTANLFGLHGVGKTFMGWVLVKDAKVEYFSHPSRITKSLVQEDRIAFVDNVSHIKADFRQSSIMVEGAGFKRVIFVSTYPVDDYVYRVELNLTNDDVNVARKNLSMLGYIPTIKDRNSLWQEILDISMR